MEDRLVDIEVSLANCEKTIEELSKIIFEQSKIVDFLVKQNRNIINAMNQDSVKPLEEETPPPHY